MKTLKNILPIAAAVLLWTSCTEILTKKPLDMLTDAAVWEDPVLIDAFLSQQYEFTPVFDQDASECITGGWRTTAVTSTDFNNAMYRSDKCGGQLTTIALAEGQAIFVPSLSMSTNFKMSGININGAPALEYWELPYKTIRNLNDFIARVPSSPMSTDMAELRVAEARFLRAYNYFAMVKRYGGVPLVTKVLKMDSPKEELFPVRNSEKECYDFILRELDDIDDVLANTTEYGRPTKEAVLAFKSRVALYAGSIAKFGTQQLDGLLGFPASEANGYFQQAFNAAKGVIDSHKHSLYRANPDKVENFKEAFLTEGAAANPEMIMVKQHTWSDFYSGGNGSSWNWLLSPYPFANGSWGGNAVAPYLEIAEMFEHADGTPGTIDRTAAQQGVWDLNDPALFGNKDPRFYASIWMQDTPWTHGPTGKVEFYDGILVDGNVLQGEGAHEGLPLHGTQNVGSAGFGILKMVDESRNPSADQGRDGQDSPIFRYAEVLLNYAEAAFELGEEGEADWAINDEIRDRAGMPEIAITRESIRHERQVELAFEGHRYWDLRRWRTAFAELNGQGHGLRYILDWDSYEANPAAPKYKLQVVEKDGATGRIFFNYNYYLPINLGRTGANGNLIENPGYN